MVRLQRASLPAPTACRVPPTASPQAARLQRSNSKDLHWGGKTATGGGGMSSGARGGGGVAVLVAVASRWLSVAHRVIRRDCAHAMHLQTPRKNSGRGREPGVYYLVHW